MENRLILDSREEPLGNRVQNANQELIVVGLIKKQLDDYIEKLNKSVKNQTNDYLKMANQLVNNKSEKVKYSNDSREPFEVKSLLTHQIEEILILKGMINSMRTHSFEQTAQLDKFLDAIHKRFSDVVESEILVRSMEMVNPQVLITAYKKLSDSLHEIKRITKNVGMIKSGICSDGGIKQEIKRFENEVYKLQICEEYYMSFTKLEIFENKPIQLKPLDIKLPRYQETIDLDHIETLINGDILKRVSNESISRKAPKSKAAPVNLPAVEETSKGKNLKPQMKEWEEFLLGLRYYYGVGVGKNTKRALEYIEKAKKNNCDEAALFIAQLYNQGTDLPKDDKLASQIFKDLSETKSNSTASHFYAKSLMEEYDREKDEDKYNRAANLFLQASQNTSDPNFESMIELGMIKEKVGKYLEASNLYREAIEKANHKEAMYRLALLMIKERIPGGKNLAFQYMKKSADLGHPGALTKLGSMYLNGYGTEKDILIAKSLLEKAGGPNLDAESLKNLGLLYYQEGALEKNPESDKFFKAQFYLRTALCVNPNHSESNYLLGCLLDGGFGGSQDPVLAAKHYIKALEADSSNSKALYRLGKVYLEGRGVAKADLNIAMDYLRRSAELNNADALIYLGDLYRGSAVVKSSPEKARQLYEKAARLGNASASQKIANLELNNGIKINSNFQGDIYKSKLASMHGGLMNHNY